MNSTVRPSMVPAWRRLRAASLATIALLCAAPAPGWCGWKNFTTADGLAHNVVSCALEDRSGNLWFGTVSGDVSRYDGSAWTTFSMDMGLGLSEVRAILEDRSGTLWFAGEGGVSRYDGTGWRMFSPLDGIYSGYTTLLEDRSGTIWAGNADGSVSRYDGSAWRRFTPDVDGLALGFITSSLEDRAGNLWLGHIGHTYGDGLSRFDGAAWRTYSTADGLTSNNVQTMLEDSSGRLWFGTDAGVSRYDGISWTTFTTANGLAGNNVHAIIEDDQSRLWFATSGGASRYEGTTWTTFTSADGLSSDGVASIFEDHAGILWFACYVGLSRYDGAAWTTWTTADGLARDDVRAIVEDQSGNLWFGTGGGVSRYDRTTWETVTAADGLAGNDVRDIEEDVAGNLWFATYGNGVSRYDGSTWTTFVATRNGLAQNYVHSILEDRSGDLWFGTGGGGVSRYDGSRWNTFTTSDGLAGNYVFALLEDRSGNYWFATDGGVSRYDGATWRTFTNADGLPPSTALSLLEDRAGNIWCGTVYGMGRFDGSTWSADLDNYSISAILEDRSGNIWCTAVRQGFEYATPEGVRRFDGSAWTAFMAADGLADNLVHGLMEDAAGNLWFGTGGGGVSRYDGTLWRSFTTADGIAGNVVQTILEDRSGNLWFGTPQGVTRYVPDRIAPQTVLATAPPRVTASRDQAVAFAAFGEADRIEFSYRLDGGIWSEWSRTANVTLTSLADGFRTLEVRSRDYLANTDPTPATAFFEVDGAPPSPVITSPVFGEAVKARVEVRGSTADPRFVRYRLEARPQGAASWDPPHGTLLAESGVSVTSGPLGAWETAALTDGLYEMRLSVTDSLGLVGAYPVAVIVDNQAPFADETSPAKVPAATGGDIYTTDREVHLYFPPRAFREDAVVIIVPTPIGSVSDTLASGATLVSPGFDIFWGAQPLAKPARLSMEAPGGVPNVALYHSSDGAAWARIGGASSGDRIEAPVTRSGTYALFAEQSVVAGDRTLSALSLTPRVFSPTGAFADRELGIGFSLGRPAPVTVRVYARNGRLMREVLAGEPMNAGANLVRWDGSDRDGESVTAGIYIVTVEALGRTERKPVAVVK